MSNWTLSDLKVWNDRIENIAKEMGLDYFPQEYEVCDYHDMLGYQSYVGMPTRYPHWSFGKAFEKQHTMYKLGMSGLAYEMVINTNPCLAYLMIDNPLAMQVLTMAHVYGHNDFFKNNIHFSHTRPELALEMFRLHSNRVRSYIETPSIGIEKVERILDAAHSIRYQTDRNLLIKSLDVQEQKNNFYKNLNREPDPWDHLKPQDSRTQYDFEPDPVLDLLGFIADNNKYLEDWERDLLNMVKKESLYFLPQMETKVMNEGWASFWHFTILNRLELPADMHMDLIRSHNQVIRPHVGGLNPYHVGYTIFTKLAGSDGHQIKYDIDPQIFEVRTVDRDISFLRRFLTQELADELHLFEYQQRGTRITISEVADDDGWNKVKNTLLKNIGSNSIPIIKVQEVNPRKNTLILKHEYDERELELNYTRKTLEHIHTLWKNPIVLDTTVDNRSVRCTFSDGNFTVEES
ncbi:SpoVR family protein [Sediminitomix flava]|uniref:Stage V sporulation protein R n=1 Tax=Sediminitomix flava TaxID=379075 RepID=A0A315Z7Z1_SEDFL|nr:SpoVR family protein [Sediminitomix flava]PWJ40035.1 stage V sporulation protein R [Sediminitomix flava]